MGRGAIGPALAGVLIAALSAVASPLVGLAQCFFWNGVSYLFVLAGLLLMRGDFSPKASNAPGTPLSALREVKVFLWEKRPALLLVCLVAVFSLFNAPYFVLLPSLAKFTLGVDAGRFGLLMSAQGVGALIAALGVATLSGYQKKGRVLMGASLALPLLTLGLTITRSFPLACLLVLLIGFAIICFLATANALLQTSTPDALRGRVMSLYSLILVGLTPVGSLWSGAVAKEWGAPVAVGRARR
jgi:predicted MFS family arabinose efflux permease